VVVGMGLNVRADGIAPDLAGSAVACEHLADGGEIPTREDLVVAWLRALEHWCALATAPAGRDGMWAAWRRRSATLGRRVRVDLGSDDLTGQAIDVTAGGQLVVRTGEGERRVLAVGDVTRLRTMSRPIRPREASPPR
jgi:BirA family biotin operon repressor/biotin-[acetyl-CoA-carboxylase] ligase